MNIIIMDTDFNQLSLVSNYKSLLFKRRFSSMGGFEIVVNVNTLNAMEIKVGRLIYLDADRVGIVEYVEIIRETDSADEMLIARGIELKDIISYRITLPPDGYVYDVYENMNIEQIVRDLINKHLINPVDSNRRMDNFSLGSNHLLGSVVNYSTRYQRLSSQIYNVLLANDMLGLLLTTDILKKNAVFEIRQGLDRTINQTENPTAIFSLNLKTSMGNQIIESVESYINTAVVGGEGEGVDRSVISVYDGEVPVGIERREAFFDESSAQNSEELLNLAYADLAMYKKVFQVECITANDLLEYDIGDFVTVIDEKLNLYENLQISGIDYEYEQGFPMTKRLMFGRLPLTMSQAINARLTGVENLLTK